MFRTLVTAVALIAFAAPALGQSDTFTSAVGTSQTNHENGVPLRDGAKARDDVDFDNLRQFAANLNLDIVALQEIGSPAALTRVFPESDYHLVMATDYVLGAENDPPAKRDIYNAFAIRKSAFPTMPAVRTLDALHILHLEVQGGAASDRPVRSGLIQPLTVAGQPVEIINVHLNPVGNCGLCHERRSLIQSHAIPHAVFRDIHRDNGGNAIVVSDDHGKLHRSGKSGRDRLLCSDREGRLNYNLTTSPS